MKVCIFLEKVNKCELTPDRLCDVWVNSADRSNITETEWLICVSKVALKKRLTT